MGWDGMGWDGMAWHGMARDEMAWQGRAWHGITPDSSVDPLSFGSIPHDFPKPLTNLWTLFGLH